MDEAEGITLKQALAVAVTFSLDCCLLDIASESDKRLGITEAVLFFWGVFLLGALFFFCLFWAEFVKPSRRRCGFVAHRLIY